jgi:hypothetical protein
MTNPEPRVPEANSATATDFPLTWRETQIAACQNRIACYRRKIQGLRSRDQKTPISPTAGPKISDAAFSGQPATLAGQQGPEEVTILERALLREQARLQKLDPEDLLD